MRVILIKLKDLLHENEPIKIMERCYGPKGEDLLVGYCQWDGQKLISLDGDYYSVNADILDHEMIYEYEGDTTYLVVWIDVTWA